MPKLAGVILIKILKLPSTLKSSSAGNAIVKCREWMIAQYVNTVKRKLAKVRQNSSNINFLLATILFQPCVTRYKVSTTELSFVFLDALVLRIGILMILSSNETINMAPNIPVSAKYWLLYSSLSKYNASSPMREFTKNTNM